MNCSKEKKGKARRMQRLYLSEAKIF